MKRVTQAPKINVRMVASDKERPSKRSIMLKKNAAKDAEMISGEGAVTRTTCKNWYQGFC